MPTVVTFGEIMLRLATKRFERFAQAREFEVTYGGGEANVAVTLANFGLNARYVTALPDNDIGQACINYVRQFGVDTSHIVRQGKRVGIYFLESGAVQRASKVIYDRAGASIAEVKRGDIDWAKAFAGADWFHWTGITPAISEGAADVCLEAIEAARAAGLTVSADLNFRKNLWKWGKAASEVMPYLVALCDVAIGNEEDADKVFGIKAPHADVEGGKVDAQDYRAVAEGLMAKFPNLKQVAITLRGSLSASHNTWSGILFDGQDLYVGPDYDITHIVDRVGGGDAFAGGLIYAMLTAKAPQDCIDFAVAASCMKHTIHGDFNMVTVAEVEGLIKGGGSGRVQR
ncbi:MAG: sugar kinase [Armatimonadetes bacterium]|nr:sugar kinase [Armatimonadota bacterium]